MGQGRASRNVLAGLRDGRLRPRLSYDQLAHGRTRKILYAFIIGYLLLLGRLFYIQVIRSPYYKDKAELLTGIRITLPAKRGTIYDRWGRKLAVSVDAYDIYAQPSKIKNKDGAAARLAPILGWDQDELLAKLTSQRNFVYLVRRADVELGKKVKEAAIPGTGAIPTMKRVYPMGSLAAQVIGITNVDGVGIEGLEKAHDEELRGRDGCVVAKVDARRVIISGSKRKQVDPVDGNDLVLTIDYTLQHALEMELEKSFQNWAAAGASAVMIDPKTGEILAMANMPTFDPNDVAASDAASRRNRAITDLYEPGSTLKVVTACAGLEEKVIDADDTFQCTGSMQIGRRTVRCSLHPPFMNGHGTANVAKILRYSCNMGAAGIGLRLGKERLHKYESRFGLYEKPGTGMLGETCGWSDRWQDWPDVRVANIAFGQGIVVTPLQLAKAYCAVANGGLMMRPYIVKEIRAPDGTTKKAFGFEAVRRVISEETAGMVCEMLHGVVTGGTGKNANVEGYRVAGKTGSAQKASTTGRGYVSGKVVASFVGFLPISDPRVVILVVVDEPHGSHFGATVAAPVFREAARTAMWHMKVAPDEIAEGTQPATSESGEQKGPVGEVTSPGRVRLGG